MGAVVLVFFFWVGVGGVVGYAIGEPKGRGREGAVLGMILGVIGWILVAVMEPTEEVRRARHSRSLRQIDPRNRSTSSPNSRRGSKSSWRGWFRQPALTDSTRRYDPMGPMPEISYCCASDEMTATAKAGGCARSP